MKRFVYFITLITALSIILSACGSSPTAPPTAPATEEAASPTAELPPPTEPPAATETAAVLVSIDLPGPQMVLGSKYLHVDGTVLVAVPGGPFIMGYNFADNPKRTVTVGDFWIDSTKITNQQYALCVQLGECSPPDPLNSPTYGDYRYINFPVTGVNHAQAGEYCSFVHGRLPTEAEWEKTARGPDGNLFPWGNTGTQCSLLNYKFCVGKTSYVNEYEDGVSYYGAWDMSGNAREWVADWYSPTYNVESPVADPLGPELGEKRSVRGSSFTDSADPSLSAHRFSLIPTENLPELGFRCVIEDPTYFAPWCEQLAYIGPGIDGSQPDCVPTVDCNKVKISQAPNCAVDEQANTYDPYTIVTFELSNTPPDGWSYGADGCALLGETPTEAKFQCDPPGPVGPAKAEGTCTFIAPAACEVCQEHFQKVGDNCEWDGSGTAGTECLPGSTYDPILQCCSSLDGTGANINLCKAGTYPLNGACVDNPKAVIDSVIQDVLFDPECKPPSDDDPGDDDDDDDDGPGDNPCPPPQQLICFGPSTAQQCYCQ